MWLWVLLIFGLKELLIQLVWKEFSHRSAFNYSDDNWNMFCHRVSRLSQRAGPTSSGKRCDLRPLFFHKPDLTWTSQVWWWASTIYESAHGNWCEMICQSLELLGVHSVLLNYIHDFCVSKVYSYTCRKLQCNFNIHFHMPTSRAGPGQLAALGKILPGAPCLTLLNIN